MNWVRVVEGVCDRTKLCHMTDRDRHHILNFQYTLHPGDVLNV